MILGVQYIDFYVYTFAKVEISYYMYIQVELQADPITDKARKHIVLRPCNQINNYTHCTCLIIIIAGKYSQAIFFLCTAILYADLNLTIID